MKNLQSFGVKPLTHEQEISINGGFIRIGGLRRLWKAGKKYGGKLLEWAGVYDAIDEFSAGFSEAEC